MRLGYNTNGFAHHRLEDAIEILADIGYQSVALTLDYHALNPRDDNFLRQRRRVGELLSRCRLACVIETGARFLLDPRRKHSPTLLDPLPSRRALRREFLRNAIEMADEFGAEAVSFWSGAAPDGRGRDEALDRLIDECRLLLEWAERRHVRLAFEPEPGMLIATMAEFEALHGRIAHPLFGLTLDAGHVHCLQDGDIAAHVHRWRDQLFNVHLEDMRRGVHEHLPFGEGDMDYAAVITALRDIAYPGGVHVELSRHSHDAVTTAQRTFEALSQLLPGDVRGKTVSAHVGG